MVSSRLRGTFLAWIASRIAVERCARSCTDPYFPRSAQPFTEKYTEKYTEQYTEQCTEQYIEQYRPINCN